MLVYHTMKVTIWNNDRVIYPENYCNKNEIIIYLM